MVAVEAAAHGLPTVAYACGGVVDAVGEGISGRLVAPGDARAFAEAVSGLLCEPLQPRRVALFARDFAWSCFGHGVLQAVGISAATAS
jgi:phosphatidylinositol alpha-1,6-mannosyltransferase